MTNRPKFYTSDYVRHCDDIFSRYPRTAIFTCTLIGPDHPMVNVLQSVARRNGARCVASLGILRGSIVTFVKVSR